MGAVVLGWDPDRGNRWTTSYEDCVRRCRDTGAVLERAAVGDWALAPVGTRVHLMALGRPRGMIGRGTVRSAPFLSADPTRPGQVIHHVLVEWDTLLPLRTPIPVEALEAAVPGLQWRRSCTTVLALTQDGAQQLDLLWAGWTAPPAQGLARRAWSLLRR
jgi:hypothetical protein